MSKPSAGAMRAAEIIQRSSGATTIMILAYAEIIDAETGLPGLLEALTELLATLEADPHIKRGYFHPWRKHARAAIKKSEGRRAS